MIYSGTPLKQTLLGPSCTVCLEYGGILNSGASLSIGMVMRTEAVEYDEATFPNLSLAVQRQMVDQCPHILLSEFCTLKVGLGNLSALRNIEVSIRSGNDLYRFI